MADSSVIPDDKMTASSFVGDNNPAYGRLNYENRAWCAEDDEWLQVDLIKAIEVCGVAIQAGKKAHLGSPIQPHGIIFKLLYSSDGHTWTPYDYGDGTTVVRWIFIINAKLN